MLDGEHEPAGEAPARERAQQHGGAQVVVRDVVGDVAEVDAQADHRRLVADRVDAARARRSTASGVAHVASGPRSTPSDVVRPPARRRVGECVEHAHPCPSGDERVDDVRADEAGSAGDEDHAGHATACSASA